MTNIERDLARIAEQERRLRFERLDANTAWDLGCRLKAACEARGGAVAIEVRIARETAFFHAMAGTTPGNADWVRRKRNTTELLHRSSYATGLALAREATSLEAKMGLPARDYASHGGSLPLLVEGLGCIGSVTVSGLPQREDHALIVEVMAGMLGLPLEEVMLEPPDQVAVP